MEPSKYQLAIYDEVKNGKGDLLVKATAGSGKTTTIVHASTLLPKHLDVAFLAFNKSIVNELKERLPTNVKCSTLHSFGYSSLYKFYKTLKGFEVKNYKTTTFTNKVIEGFKIPYKDMDKTKWIVSDVLEKARLNHIPNERKDLEIIADYYGISYEQKDIEVAMNVYEDLMEYNEVKVAEKKMIDFTDMIYLPSFYDVVMPKFDVVFIDEAQDLNKSQQILIKKIKKANGRAIFVGDENQAIYRFAGADAESFNSLITEDTVQLPLSVSYRCPKLVVREAQQVIGEEHIQYFEGQQNGTVVRGSFEDIKEGDMVVCRNNAPLFSLYFDLLAKGVKASIKGKEIEKQLLNLVKKVRFSTIDEGIEKLNLMLEKIEDEQRKKGFVNPERSKRVQNFNEMCRILTFLGEGKSMMLEVEQELKEIFNDDKDSANLMTIHKCKGLEAERVHFLLPDLIPSRWAESDEEFKQEFNLKFVAITRSKSFLSYIENYENRVDI